MEVRRVEHPSPTTTRGVVACEGGGGLRGGHRVLVAGGAAMSISARFATPWPGVHPELRNGGMVAWFRWARRRRGTLV